VKCDQARDQLAWVAEGLESLQFDIVTRSRAAETVGPEIVELHAHAMQLAATWCRR